MAGPVLASAAWTAAPLPPRWPACGTKPRFPSHASPAHFENTPWIDNGRLLRSDLHNLFDLGYLTVTVDYKVKVSRRIKEEFENGRHYYELADRQLQILSRTEAARPAREFLEWHQGIFKG